MESYSNAMSTKYNLEDFYNLFNKYCPPILDMAKGTKLTRQGESNKWLFYLVEGFVKIYTSNSRGQERIVGFMHPNTLIGITDLSDNEPSAVTIEASTNVKVIPCNMSSLKK